MLLLGHIGTESLVFLILGSILLLLRLLRLLLVAAAGTLLHESALLLELVKAF